MRTSFQRNFRPKGKEVYTECQLNGKWKEVYDYKES